MEGAGALHTTTAACGGGSGDTTLSASDSTADSAKGAAEADDGTGEGDSEEDLEAAAAAAETERRMDLDAFRYLTGLLAQGTIGVDIGGTAGKIVYLQTDEEAGREVRRRRSFGRTGVRLEQLELKAEALGGRLHFLKWSTSRVQPFCDQVQRERQRADSGGSPPGTPRGRTRLFATGGGAFKFEKALTETLGLVYHKLAEFDALARGLRYLLQHHPATVYTIDAGDREVSSGFNPETDFPAAVCNIGSGTSVLRLNSDGTYERLGGTSIGGSTFLGLCRLTTGADSFESALALARAGDSRAVDTTVADIYGANGVQMLGLPPDAPASSFGRIVGMSDEAVDRIAKEDVAASLVATVTQAIQQISVGLAKRGKCRTLLFTGGFLRGNELSQKKLAGFARLVNERALFLQHAEYAGALGCLCKTVDRQRLPPPPPPPSPSEAVEGGGGSPVAAAAAAAAAGATTTASSTAKATATAAAVVGPQRVLSPLMSTRISD